VNRKHYLPTLPETGFDKSIPALQGAEAQSRHKQRKIAQYFKLNSNNRPALKFNAYSPTFSPYSIVCASGAFLKIATIQIWRNAQS
jgi:hypothetical protein